MSGKKHLKLVRMKIGPESAIPSHMGHIVLRLTSSVLLFCFETENNIEFVILLLPKSWDKRSSEE